MTGQIMGTPEYMSPEQCLGDKIDHRSDVYALGIAVYEIFTGTVPFRGDTPVATLFKHIQDPVPFEGPVAARIPLAAVPVLRKALAKNRADRFASASEMAEALRKAHQQTLAGVPADAAPTGGLPAIVPPGAAGAMPTPTPSERRRVTRLDIFVNFVVRRVGTLGTVLQEERTIAENVGRGGARVMTTMASLAPGDIVHLEEVGRALQDPRRGARELRRQGPHPPPQPPLPRQPRPRLPRPRGRRLAPQVAEPPPGEPRPGPGRHPGRDLAGIRP